MDIRLSFTFEDFKGNFLHTITTKCKLALIDKLPQVNDEMELESDDTCKMSGIFTVTQRRYIGTILSTKEISLTLKRNY